MKKDAGLVNCIFFLFDTLAIFIDMNDGISK